MKLEDILKVEFCQGRKEFIDQFCNINAVENEFHVLTQCSSYNNERDKLFEKVRNFNCNFVLLNDIVKARWLLLQNKSDILLALGSYIHNCFEIRNNKSDIKRCSLYIHMAVDVLHIFIHHFS